MNKEKIKDKTKDKLYIAMCYTCGSTWQTTIQYKDKDECPFCGSNNIQ